MSAPEPLQSRSIETRDRLLEAAERLLRRHPWSSISAQRLAREAGFTTGALYGRFGGKGEVLALLLERLRERIGRSLDTLEAAAWAESGPQVLDLLADHLVSLYRGNGSLLRSLREAARDDEALRRELGEVNREIHDRLADLLGAAYGMRKQDPRPGVALLLLIPPLHELLVERDYWPRSEDDLPGLLAEIRRAVGIYLEAGR